MGEKKKRRGKGASSSTSRVVSVAREGERRRRMSTGKGGKEKKKRRKGVRRRALRYLLNLFPPQEGGEGGGNWERKPNMLRDGRKRGEKKKKEKGDALRTNFEMVSSSGERKGERKRGTTHSKRKKEGKGRKGFCRDSLLTHVWCMKGRGEKT